MVFISAPRACDGNTGTFTPLSTMFSATTSHLQAPQVLNTCCNYSTSSNAQCLCICT